MVIQKIRGKLWDLQSKYNYEGINELLNMCTYLDSRFKSMQIEDGTSITFGNQRLGLRRYWNLKREDKSTSQWCTGSTPPEVTEAFASQCSSSAYNSSKLRKLFSWMKEAAETHVSPGERSRMQMGCRKIWKFIITGFRTRSTYCKWCKVYQVVFLPCQNLHKSIFTCLQVVCIGEDFQLLS